MASIRKLNPHDPVPEDGPNIVVLRRFRDDDPSQVVVEIAETIRDGRERRRLAVHPDGTPMGWDEALEAARHEAEAAGLREVIAIDRTAGGREHDVLAHHGDRTVGMGALDDMDLEEGERGPDMRDPSGNSQMR